MKENGTIDNIFETCDSEYRRTKGMDYDYMACMFEGECPYKMKDVTVRVKMFERGIGDDFIGPETIENLPRCHYPKSEKLEHPRYENGKVITWKVTK